MDNVVKFMCEYKGISLNILAKEVGVFYSNLRTRVNGGEYLLFQARLLAGYFGISIEGIARNRIILVKYSKDGSFALTEEEVSLMNYTVSAGEEFEVQVVYKVGNDWRRRKTVYRKEETSA